jgi:hypothetical protein
LVPERWCEYFAGQYNVALTFHTVPTEHTHGKEQEAETPKSSVKRRSRVVSGSQVQTNAAPGGDKDIKGRLGNFTAAGEHARIGGRTSGIVGQTTTRNRTDKRKK